MTVRVYHITTTELLEMINNNGHKMSRNTLMAQIKRKLLPAGLCIKKPNTYLFSDNAIDHIEIRPRGRQRIAK